MPLTGKSNTTPKSERHGKLWASIYVAWTQIHRCTDTHKVLNIGYRDRIGWEFFISDIGGDIADTHAYQEFISDTIYNEILITKSWFSVIDII